MIYETILYSSLGSSTTDTGIIYETIVFGTEIAISDKVVTDYEAIKDAAIQGIEESVASASATHTDTIVMTGASVFYTISKTGIIKSITNGNIERNSVLLGVGSAVMIGDQITAMGTQGVNIVVEINISDSAVSITPIVAGGEIKYANIQAVEWIPELNDYIIINSLLAGFLKTNNGLNIPYNGAYESVINYVPKLLYENGFIFLGINVGLLKYNVSTGVIQQKLLSNTIGFYQTSNRILTISYTGNPTILDKNMNEQANFAGNSYKDGAIVGNRYILLRGATTLNLLIKENYTSLTFSTSSIPVRTIADGTIAYIGCATHIHKLDTISETIVGTISTSGSVNYMFVTATHIYAFDVTGRVYKITKSTFTVDSGFPKTGLVTVIDGWQIGNFVYLLSNLKSLQTWDITTELPVKTKNIPSTNNSTQGRLNYDATNQILFALQNLYTTFPTYSAGYKLTDLQP